MYKLFIVDDEPLVRDGLRDYFDWGKYGIEVVGEAEDGEAALQAFSLLKPHIVLTDVKMPNIDGILLAGRLREQMPDIKIIFISGHDDVEYLKSALKVDAVDYIFKPVNFKELGAVIEKVLGILGGEEKQKDLIYSMNIKLMQSMPYLREKFFMTLVRDECEEGEELRNKLEFLELKLPVQGLFCTFVITIDDRVSIFENMPERDRQLTSFSVLNICQELIDTHLHGYVFENLQGEFVGILSFVAEENEEQLFTLASEIKDNLLKYLQLSVTIGVGKTVQKLNKVYQSYSMAFEAVSQKLFLGKNKVITIDNLQTDHENEYRFDTMKLEKFSAVVKAADEEKLIALTEEVFCELANARKVNIKYCQNLCLQFILLASRLMIEMEIRTEVLEMDESILWEQVFKQETVEDMKRLIIHYFVKVCRYINDKRSKKSRNVIQQIKDIIHARYKENLTVNDIANEVYLTSTYVCLIFKQETGETINDYITKLRIEKAKELLKDSRNKLYDICYAVGYSDPSYFSKLFKKYTGLSPTEYREKVI